MVCWPSCAATLTAGLAVLLAPNLQGCQEPQKPQGFQSNVMAFEPFINNSGLSTDNTINVHGQIEIFTDKRKSQTLRWVLRGVDPRCGHLGSLDDQPTNVCGIHVHTGHGCGKDIGGDYFVEHGGDPWLPVHYFTTEGTDTSEGLYAEVHTGLTVSDLRDHSVVITDSLGNYIACGLICSYPEVASSHGTHGGLTQLRCSLPHSHSSTDSPATTRSTPWSTTARASVSSSTTASVSAHDAHSKLPRSSVSSTSRISSATNIDSSAHSSQSRTSVHPSSSKSQDSSTTSSKRGSNSSTSSNNSSRSISRQKHSTSSSVGRSSRETSISSSKSSTSSRSTRSTSERSTSNSTHNGSRTSTTSSAPRSLTSSPSPGSIHDRSGGSSNQSTTGTSSPAHSRARRVSGTNARTSPSNEHRQRRTSRAWTATPRSKSSSSTPTSSSSSSSRGSTTTSDSSTSSSSSSSAHGLRHLSEASLSSTAASTSLTTGHRIGKGLKHRKTEGKSTSQTSTKPTNSSMTTLEAHHTMHAGRNTTAVPAVAAGHSTAEQTHLTITTSMATSTFHSRSSTSNMAEKSTSQTSTKPTKTPMHAGRNTSAAPAVAAGHSTAEQTHLSITTSMATSTFHSRSSTSNTGLGAHVSTTSPVTSRRSHTTEGKQHLMHDEVVKSFIDLALVSTLVCILVMIACFSIKRRMAEAISVHGKRQSCEVRDADMCFYELPSLLGVVGSATFLCLTPGDIVGRPTSVATDRWPIIGLAASLVAAALGGVYATGALSRLSRVFGARCRLACRLWLALPEALFLYLFSWASVPLFQLAAKQAEEQRWLHIVLSVLGLGGLIYWQVAATLEKCKPVVKVSDTRAVDIAVGLQQPLLQQKTISQEVDTAIVDAPLGPLDKAIYVVHPAIGLAELFWKPLVALLWGWYRELGHLWRPLDAEVLIVCFVAVAIVMSALAGIFAQSSSRKVSTGAIVGGVCAGLVIALSVKQVAPVTGSHHFLRSTWRTFPYGLAIVDLLVASTVLICSSGSVLLCKQRRWSPAEQHVPKAVKAATETVSSLVVPLPSQPPLPDARQLSEVETGAPAASAADASSAAEEIKRLKAELDRSQQQVAEMQKARQADKETIMSFKDGLETCKVALRKACRAHEKELQAKQDYVRELEGGVRRAQGELQEVMAVMATRLAAMKDVKMLCQDQVTIRDHRIHELEENLAQLRRLTSTSPAEAALQSPMVHPELHLPQDGFTGASSHQPNRRSLTEIAAELDELENGLGLTSDALRSSTFGGSPMVGLSPDLLHSALATGSALLPSIEKKTRLTQLE